MKKVTILTFVILLAIGCKHNSEMYNSLSKADATASSMNSASLDFEEEFEVSPPRTNSQEKPKGESMAEKGNKIIKEGNMHIEVVNIIASKNYVDSIIARNQAYYEKEVFKNDSYNQRYSLKLRIPSMNFNSVVHSLEQGDGTILEKNINAKDVTEEYLDLEIRLENNRAYLKRYKELLNKAKSIKDMIEIQEKVRRIEMLVDANIGRIKYLTDRVNYSTLSIELTEIPEEVTASVPPSYFEKIIDASKSGFSGLLYFILVIVNLWPILLGFIFIWMLRNKMFGFLKKRRNISST